MPGQDATEITIAGAGKVYAAPSGTALPTTPTAALNASFLELGYHSEDGVTFSDTPTTEAVRAWQSYYDVRRFVTAREASVGMTLQQWNEQTFSLYFGGGTDTSPVGGVYKFEPPAPGATPYKRALVIQFADGATRNFRIVCPNVELREASEVTLNKGANAGLQVTLAVLGSDTTAAWWMLTDDWAFDPVGS